MKINAPQKDTELPIEIDTLTKEALKMNHFYTFFTNRATSDIDKWSNYFDLYEKYFSKFSSQPIHFLEIGVDQGGSLEMWRSYFPKDAVIVGLDINPQCKKFEEPSKNKFVEIGDQNDSAFLEYLIEKYEYFDVILDDGSHFFEHQIKSFESLWKILSPNGIYMIEDCHSSYYPVYGGWPKASHTFIEYSKNIVDELNSHHRLDFIEKSSRFQDLYGLYFHSGVVVVEKKNYIMPYAYRSGKDSEKFSAQDEAYKQLNSYIAKASFIRAVYWYMKMLFCMLIGKKAISRTYSIQLKARRLLKRIMKMI